MSAVPDYVKDFMRDVPTCWDDTRFIDGFPGKLVVIARKSKDIWYVAGINGENIQKNLNFDLSFLEDSKTGILITDGTDNRSFNMQKITYVPGRVTSPTRARPWTRSNRPSIGWTGLSTNGGSSGKLFEIKLREYGGFVIKFEN
jgi:hypothetical protein